MNVLGDLAGQVAGSMVTIPAWIVPLLIVNFVNILSSLGKIAVSSAVTAVIIFTVRLFDISFGYLPLGNLFFYALGSGVWAVVFIGIAKLISKPNTSVR